MNSSGITLLKEKEEHLDRILKEMEGMVIAFSGGVDSTYLLLKAVSILGKDGVLAVTAASALYPPEDTEEAGRLAAYLAVNHLIIHTDELSQEDFCANPPERCYYCKNELFAELETLAKEHSLPAVADGANLDDAADFRPGSKAAKERGVRSPLQEAGLTKEEIRLLSREKDLPTWDKPSAACLASRFPYGERLELEKISRVGRGEQFLKQLGLRREVRVRYHGSVARIEAAPEEFHLLLEHRQSIANLFNELGFLYVTLDLEGFHSGSMNRALSKEQA